MLDDLRFRLRTLFRRRAVEDDLDQELRFHLERAADRYVARGLPREEAYRRARVAFGPVDAVKDDCRQSWGIRQLDALREDAAFALRLIRRQPVLSAVATAALAVGIGLNAALFALLDATLLRRLAVDRPEQLVDVYVSNDGGYGWYGSSYPDYLDLRRGAPALTGLAGHVPVMAAVATDAESRARPGEAVTGNYFHVLGVRAARGRTLLPDDDRPGAAPVVVISTALWAAAYDRDPHAVGRTLRIGGRSYAIVGVAPEAFSGMTAPILSAAFWMPITRIGDVQPVMMQSGSPAPGATRLESRGLRWMLLKGRLRKGETVAGAALELNRVMRALDAIYPASNAGLRATVFRTRDMATHPLFEDRVRAGAASLVALCGLVMLIACANVAGLLLARATSRRREMGLRVAVGASRGRLLRQLLVESTLLALLGAAGGAALAWGLLQALGAVRAPLLVPVALDLPLTGRMLGAAVGVAVLAGVAAGLLPACAATRSRSLGEPVGRMPFGAAAPRWSLRHALVALQVASSLVLLVMAGLLARNLQAVSRIDPGFAARSIASATIGLGLGGYDEDEAARFLERARQRVGALPGVEAVARASRAPLSINYRQTRVRRADERGQETAAVPVEMVTVGDGYFDALAVRILEGRAFDADIDTRGAPRVAIVNEAFARRLWPDARAVGRRIRPWDGEGPTVEIVGVVRDYRVRFLHEPPTPYVHYPAVQRPADVVLAPVLLARTAGDVAGLGAAMREQLRAIDPDIVFWEGLTLGDNLAAQLLPARLLATALGTAGAVAVWLAAIGLYGVVAFAVVRRTHEIGVRMALGATGRDVVLLVIRQGALLLAGGVAVGSTAAFGAARATAGVLFGIDASDAPAWGGALLVLAAVGVAVFAAPTLRAVRIQPSSALRAE